MQNMTESPKISVKGQAWKANVGLLKSYLLAKLHTVRIPQQDKTVNGMFTLYKIILIEINL